MTTDRRLRRRRRRSGHWGPNLARNFAALPSSELARCCDASEGMRARFAPAFPGTRFTADLDEVLADGTVDVVRVREALQRSLDESRRQGVARSPALTG